MARKLSSGGYFSHADGEPYDIGTVFHTVACWFQPMALGVEHFLIAKWGGGSTARSYVLEILSDNRPLFATHVTAGAVGITQILFTPDPALSVGTWFHVAATRNGVRQKMYYNGKIVADAADTSSIPDNTSLLFYLGHGSQGQTADGSMSQACMWRACLTGDEIVALYEGQREPTDIRPGSLVGYWPLDNYGDANDLSNFALPLTMVSTPAVIPDNRPRLASPASRLLQPFFFPSPSSSLYQPGYKFGFL